MTCTTDTNSITVAEEVVGAIQGWASTLAD